MSLSRQLLNSAVENPAVCFHFWIGTLHPFLTNSVIKEWGAGNGLGGAMAGITEYKTVGKHKLC
jgi:hypothetical protein